MPISMHDLTAPTYKRVLGSMKNVLSKAEAHATAKKIDPNALLLARLFPDMFNTIRQVQTATTMVHWGCALLAGLERPQLPDAETTFEHLYARIQKTMDYAAGFGPDKIDGTEAKAVALVFPGRTMEFTGQSFIQEFIIPNLYFHSGMTYAILRHNGVEVGKGDFLRG